MGISSIPATIWDFIAKPEVSDEGGPVHHIVEAVKALARGVIGKPWSKLKNAGRHTIDTIRGTISNAVNTPRLNPFKLVANLGRDTALTANQATELTERTIGGTIETAETLDQEVCNAVDHTNLAVRSVLGWLKKIPLINKIPLYARTITLASALTFAPLTVSSKVARTPATISQKIRERVEGTVYPFHGNIRTKAAIPPRGGGSAATAPSAPAEAAEGAVAA